MYATAAGGGVWIQNLIRKGGVAFYKLQATTPTTASSSSSSSSKQQRGQSPHDHTHINHAQESWIQKTNQGPFLS